MNILRIYSGRVHRNRVHSSPVLRTGVGGKRASWRRIERFVKTATRRGLAVVIITDRPDDWFAFFDVWEHWVLVRSAAATISADMASCLNARAGSPPLIIGVDQVHEMTSTVANFVSCSVGDGLFIADLMHARVEPANVES